LALWNPFFGPRPLMLLLVSPRSSFSLPFISFQILPNLSPRLPEVSSFSIHFFPLFPSVDFFVFSRDCNSHPPFPNPSFLFLLFFLLFFCDGISPSSHARFLLHSVRLRAVFAFLFPCPFFSSLTRRGRFFPPPSLFSKAPADEWTLGSNNSLSLHPAAPP